MSASGNLAERLRERIEREGPISFYEWMKSALYDEHEGYYCRADRIPQGRAGDYRTAPEISPLFAAAFASYFSLFHTDLKWPQSWTILEVGAGGGEFAHGVLSHLRDHLPEVFAATRYVIDDVSGATRARAAHRLAEFADRVRFQRLEEISEPLNAGIVFSNELIDAFPVHRVIMRDGELRELCVGTSETGFTWVEWDLEPAVADYCLRTEAHLAEGQVVEVNLKAEEFISRAAASLNRGYVITVDYGAEREELWGAPDRHLGTLRAFRRHQFVDDVLARPGEQDLTSTIDWTQVLEGGERAGLQAIKFQRLDQFLQSQLTAMMAAVSSANGPVEAIRLSTGARELILPTGLAASFQVLVQEKIQ